jgi:hypothetical protein
MGLNIEYTELNVEWYNKTSCNTGFYNTGFCHPGFTPNIIRADSQREIEEDKSIGSIDLNKHD